MACLRTLVCILAATGVLAGCGDTGGPAAPTSTARPSQGSTFGIPGGTVLRIVSGAGGAPVAGAELRIEGTMLRSDRDGQVPLPDGYDRGTLLGIVADGFLERLTLLRDAENTRFTLWPREHESGLNETFTKDLVYGGIDGTLDGLIRVIPPAEEAYVVPSPPIRRDDRAMRMVQFAADSVTAATRGQLRFTVANQVPSGGVVFELIIDPEDPDLVDAVGVAKRRYRGYAIIGGSAVFDSLERVRTSTTTHELGHLFGLSHTNGIKDVMNTNRRRGTIERFSPREQLAMRLVLQRPPRNEFPDNDQDVTQPLGLSADVEWTDVVRCYESSSQNERSSLRTR